jgi:hypothetical protein
MIAPFSKFKEDLKEAVSRIYNQKTQEEFENSLAGWDCYADLKVNSHDWWEALHWDPNPDDDDNYNVPPKMIEMNIIELFVERGIMTMEDMTLVKSCMDRIRRVAYEERNLTYPKSSYSLLFKGIDEAVQIQQTIGDDDQGIYDILGI